MPMRMLILAALSSLGLAGCATQVFDIRGGPGVYKAETKLRIFLFGVTIEEAGALNAAKICGGQDRVARIVTGRTWQDEAISMLANELSKDSSSPVSTRTASVYCLPEKNP